MLKYMFDTNIVIYVIKRRPLEVLETFNRHAGQMCISSITFAELIHGAEKSSRPQINTLVYNNSSPAPSSAKLGRCSGA